MTQVVAEIEVFLEVISASTPKHTTHKKSHCDEWLFSFKKKFYSIPVITLNAAEYIFKAPPEKFKVTPCVTLN